MKTAGKMELSFGRLDRGAGCRPERRDYARQGGAGR